MRSRRRPERSSAQLLLERLANLRPRAMQEHALVRLAELEQLADIVRLPALDVAEDDHVALFRRQLFDRGFQRVERLASAEMLFGQLVPAGRRARPVARPARVLLVEETVRVDRGLVVVGVAGWQRRERHGPALALPAGLRGVREDAEDPGLQGGALLEAMDAA